MQYRGLLRFLHHSPQADRLGHTRISRGHSQNSWPQVTKGIPQTMWCRSLRGKDKEGGDIQLWDLSSQISVTHEEALLSWGQLNICLVMERSEWTTYFALLACRAFVLPIKLFLSQSTSFLAFALPILTPSHWGRVSSCVGLSCWLSEPTTGNKNNWLLTMVFCLQFNDFC